MRSSTQRRVSPAVPELGPAACSVRLLHSSNAATETGFGEERTAPTTGFEDFLTVAPDLRGRIRSVHGQTWPYCFSVLAAARLAVLDELRRPVGGIDFVGDYSSATAGTHGCYDEAHRVATAEHSGGVEVERGARTDRRPGRSR